MLLKQLILLCAKQLQKQRSSSAIYHLITGKRSIQTVQDAHLFGIDCFYGVLRTLSRQKFIERMNTYKSAELLREIDSPHFTYVSLTNKGQSYLTTVGKQLSYFNGLKFYKSDELFYKKVLLLTQVLTNQYNENSSYIPIIDDENILKWMRKYYGQIKHDLKTYLYYLYDDLYTLLIHFPNEEADIFVKRLSAYKHYGLSIQQLSSTYNYSVEHIQLLLRAMIHKMLQLIKDDTVTLKVLNLIVDDLPSYNMLTKSAKTTYELLNKQYTVEQIASIRRLKMSTIYDHIVEICWYDQNFPVDQYVTKEQMDQVKQAVIKAQSLQLKLIKHFAPDELTYFQIRIALTRIKNIFFEGEPVDDHKYYS